MNLIKEKTTHKQKNEARTFYKLKEHFNPMFSLNVDLFRSSPVESLHTVLLGTCKYLLKSSMSSRNEQEKKQILARMSGFNYSGFSTKVYGNVCYYY